MPLINDGNGCIEERVNPHVGTAKIRWRPLSPLNDNENALHPVKAGWNAGDLKWRWRTWVKLEARIWPDDPFPPFSWFVLNPVVRERRSPNVATHLFVFVAPHVTLKKFDITVDEGFEKPNVTIIRLDSWEEVPIPGAEANLGDYLGERPVDEMFHGMINTKKKRSGRNNKNGPLGEVRGYLAADIMRSPRGITITKRFHEWRIGVILDEEKPGFFHIDLVGTSAGRWVDYLGRTKSFAVHHFRIYHSKHVKVTFELDSFAFHYAYPSSSLKPEWVSSPPTATVERILVDFPQTTESRPLFPALAGNPAASKKVLAIEADGLADIGDGRRAGGLEVPKDLVPTVFDNPRYKIMTMFISTLIGLNPVAGLMWDVADCVSIGFTGKDLFGMQKTKTDIAIISAFALFGVVGDLARAGSKSVGRGSMDLSGQDFSNINTIGQSQFPGATIITDNPHFTATLLRAVFDSANPALRRAIEDLSGGGGSSRELAELSALIKERDATWPFTPARYGVEVRLTKYGDELAERVYKQMRKNADELEMHDHPAVLSIVQREGSDLLRVDEIKALPDEIRKPLEDILATADADFDPATALKEIAALSKQADDTGQMHGNIEMLMDEMILSKVRARLKRHPALVKRHRSYNSGRTDPVDLETYVLNNARKGGSTIEYFELLYGAKVVEKMRTGTGRPTPAQILEANSTYADEARRLLNDVNEYWRHRDRIEERFPGLGRILNSDHIVEKRLRKMVDDPTGINTDGFTAILVPADADVAKLLVKNGVSPGWYIHVLKTLRMNELLPQGDEHLFSLDDVCAVYQYFLVHEAGANYTTFLGLVHADLKQIALAKKGFHNSASQAADKKIQAAATDALNKALRERSQAELLAEIDLFRTRLKLDPITFKAIGNRLTSAHEQ